MTNQHQEQEIILKPKLNGFLITYIIFSLPGFLISLLIILLIFFVFLGAIFSTSSEATELSSGELKLNTLTQNSSESGILIYNLNGPISVGSSNSPSLVRETQIYTEKVAQDIRNLKNIPQVKNVVFRFNSPGGELVASKILGKQIQELSTTLDSNETESVFYYDRLSASGALYATYTTEKSYVVASDYGETGSIGVITTLPNLSGTAEKIGYSQTVVKSSNYKDLGNIFRDPTTEEVKYIQDQINTEFNQFKTLLKKSRNLNDGQVERVTTGEVFNNVEAKNLGLIDEIGGLDVAIARAAKNVDLSSYNVYEVDSAGTTLDNLFAEGGLQSYFLSGNLNKAIDRTTFFLPGRVYLIDENRI